MDERLLNVTEKAFEQEYIEEWDEDVEECYFEEE